MLTRTEDLFSPKPCTPPLPFLEAVHPWALLLAVVLAVGTAAAAAVWIRANDPTVSRAGGIVAGLSLVGASGAAGVWLLTGMDC